MYRSCSIKNHSFAAVWVISAIFIAAGSLAGQTSGSAFVIDSACSKIIEGDFETAAQIVDGSDLPDNQSLRALKDVLNEYTAVEQRRKALRDEVYQTQTDELEKLRQEGFSDDADEIDKVFSVALKISEYTDKTQNQTLLNNPILVQAVAKAKAKAAEFESSGQWLDAYTVCYGKLARIYQNSEEYTDHADQLLTKADIRTFLQDSPCQTCKERYAGIEKQMFIDAFEILDSSYINIIDYRRIAVKGIERCELLVEVMNKLDESNEYKITDSQYAVWLEALGEITGRVDSLQTDMGKDELLNVFNGVLAINRSYRTHAPLPTILLVSQFAKGAMSGLDPYTVIYWPSQVKDFERSITNQFSGIGIKFSKKDGLAKVESVLPDTPAYKSGLQAGDTIMEVGGVETKDISSDCVVKKITGPEGTKVMLTVRHSDEDKARDITLPRARITVPSVHGWQQAETGKWLYMLEGADKIGYIRISSFNSRTADDFENVLTRLEANRLKGLILDLRSNPGGLLTAAVEIADKFITEGLLLRTQPRFGMAKYISAHQAGTHADFPVVVLINQSTASASEILAGVLQDQKYNRATLIGERSYGKGSVQSITSYCGDGAKLKYTMAYYHLPSGQRVESRYLMKESGRTDWGILPSVNVQLQTSELQEIARVQKSNEFATATGKHDVPDTTDRYSSQETIDTDPQLAVGVLVLKSKMIQASQHRRYVKF